MGVELLVFDLTIDAVVDNVSTGTSDAGLRMIAAIATTLIKPPANKLPKTQVSFCPFPGVFCEKDGEGNKG